LELIVEEEFLLGDGDDVAFLLVSQAAKSFNTSDALGLATDSEWLLTLLAKR